MINTPICVLIATLYCLYLIGGKGVSSVAAARWLLLCPCLCNISWILLRFAPCAHLARMELDEWMDEWIVVTLSDQNSTSVEGNDPVPGGWATKIVVPALVQLRNAAVGLRLDPLKILSELSGPYISVFKGRGVEFAESRPYQAGDEVRYMDWRVTARTGKPYTKVYHEDRERVILIWVDLRRAMFFATRGTFKAVLAARCATLVAWGAALHGDRVGGVLFADERHREMRPARGDRAVLQLIGRMVSFIPKQWTLPYYWQEHEKEQEETLVESNHLPQTMEDSLIGLRRVTKPGSQLFLLSDFNQLGEREKVHVAQLARQNDVIMVVIYDPLERALPPPGGYPVGEGRRRYFLDSHSARKRRQYQEKFQKRWQEIYGFCRQNGMGLIPCSTEEDIVALIQRSFGMPVSSTGQKGQGNTGQGNKGQGNKDQA